MRAHYTMNDVQNVWVSALNLNTNISLTWENLP